MNNTTTNAWKRVVAFILTLVMVFGMLPTNVAFAEELPEQSTDAASGTEGGAGEASGEEAPTAAVLLGTVEPITPGGTLKADGNGVSYSNLSLKWVEKNAAVGRNEDGWWVGIKVNAPSTMLTEQDFANVTYNYNGGETKSFWDRQDSDKTAESAQRYITLWGLVNENWAASFAKDGKTLNYIWNFDWNGDTVTDQTVTLTVDPKTVTLMKGEAQMFPAPYGEGNVTAITAGAAVADNVVTYTNLTLNWVAADSSVERNQNGWWVGIKVEAPADISAAELENAKYMSGTQEKSFWTNRDSADEEQHYITLWGLVNEEYLLMALNKEGEKVLNYNWYFDWNNDGYYEQNVRVVVYAENVVLVKNGAQVYPYTVTFAHGNGVTFTDPDGNQLDSVTVRPTESVSFKYTFADEDKGYEVTIKDGKTVLTAVEGVYTISGVTASCTITAEVRDNTVPTITEVAVSNADVWATSKEITVKAEDNSGAVTTYISTVSYDKNQVADLMANETAASSCQVTTHIGTGESVTYYVYAVDASGNMTKTSVDVLMIDLTAPEFTDFTAQDNVKTGLLGNSYVADTTYTFKVVDNESGVKKVWCVYTEWDWGKFDYVEATKELKPDENGTYSFTCKGSVTFYAENNVGLSNSKLVDPDNQDKGDPVIDDITVPTDWVAKEAVISCKVTDSGENASGVNAVYWSTKKDSYDPANVLTKNSSGSYEATITENGTYYIHAVDNYGNLAEPKEFEVEFIDNDTPTVSVEASANGWTNKNVEITIKADDELSGVKNVYYSTTEPDFTNGEPKGEKAKYNKNSGNYSFTVKEEGVFTYYIWVVDNVDQVSKVVTIEVKIDKTAPVVEKAIFTDNLGTERKIGGIVLYAYAGKVNVEVTATDDSSGIVKYEYILSNFGGEYEEWIPVEGASFPVEREDFKGRVLVRVTDAAGNQSVVWKDGSENTYCVAYHPDGVVPSGAKATYIILDSSKCAAPEVTMKVGEEKYTHEWTNQDVTVTLNANAASGIDHYEYSVDGGDWIPLDSFSTDAEEYTYEWTISGNTNAEYKFRAVSVSGIIGEETKAYKVLIHMDAPDEASMTISGEKTTDDNDWYINVPTITIIPAKSEDNGPEVYTEYVILNQGTMPNEEDWKNISEYEDLEEELNGNVDGKFTIMIRTRDEAGNMTLTFLDMTGVEVNTGTEENTGTEGETGTEENTEVATGVSRDSLAFNIDTTAPTDLTINIEQEKMQEKKDENGETVLDEDGKPVMELVLDEDGNPVMEPVLDEDGNPDNLIVEGDNTFFGDYCYNRKIIIRLNANLDVSGEHDGSLKYLIVPNYGAYTPDSAEYTNEWVKYDSETGIVIDPNEKFVLIFRAEDAAGNVTIVHSAGIIVDNEAPSADEVKKPGVADAAIIFDIPDADGENGFYVDKDKKGSFEIKINVFDPRIDETLLGGDENNQSGLASITYVLKTVEESDLAQKGSIKIVDQENDLVVKQGGKISVDTEHFDGHTVYIEVIAVDEAGNSKTFTSKEMKIDISNPDVSVKFVPTSGNDGNKYFNVTRTATVTVLERNFDPEKTTVTITAELDGKKIDAPAVKFEQDEENADIWTATIDFEEDGDYTFAVDVTDLAGHNVPDENVDYGENQHTHEFTIDKTLPVINVSYDNNTVTNGKYFKDYRVATVVVTERHFDTTNTAATITATLDGQNIDIPAADFYPSGANTYTAVIRYEADGDYTFTASATDLAGNSNQGIHYGTSEAPTEFTIDTAAETPTVGGVENGGAYKDEVAPSVDIYDVNYERYTLTLTRTNGTNKDEDVTEQFFDLIEFDAPGGTLHTEDIPHVEENDGIYTLTVVIYDMAGNSTTTTTIFTVNRFGSVYKFGEYLAGLAEGEGAYVTEVTEDLTLTEYNPDQLEEGSVQIEITRDGKPLDIDEDDFTVTPTPNDLVGYGESGWYEYDYTINMENFTEDGVYKITILTKDKTGNECQSDTITFHVDKTAPELSSVVGLEESIINAQEVDVRYTVFDAIGLESVTIYVNGEVYEVITDFGDDFNNYTGTFKLTESNDVQSVQIVIKDLAGNILDTDAEDFTSAYEFNSRVTVSTNWFVRWFANKPLFFGSLAGIGGGLWLLWFLIFGKRKKEEEEEQTV